ncbi:Cupredoxin [Tuber brumale]|nr:Cupredoxin [Tuber brumale]
MLSPLPLTLALLFPATAVLAATVTYDFNITWTTANPDGLFPRRTMGINGKWPIPTIEVNKGDRLIVNMYNGLEDQVTSLHFHGIFQNGTSYMDGPAKVTQCPVAPGQNFKYDFMVNQPGTYWYHSHVKGQYPDGLRGALIVHDNDSPHKSLYDSEVVLTFSDWYHEQMPKLISRFLSVANPTGAEPVPQCALINEVRDVKIKVEPGKTYLFRMINIGAFAAQYVWFEGHTMRVVEVDGVYTKPMEAGVLYLTAAQRVSVLITMKNSTGDNFPFVGSMDQDLFDQVPQGLDPNVTGHLVYSDSNKNPPAKKIPEFNPFDDFLLEPEDGEVLLENPDYSFNLDVVMDNLNDGANYAFFNEITYVAPKVPTLYTALSAGEHATNPAIYGRDTNSFVLKHNQVIEIILNNLDPGKHPFHLHGHNFQLVHRSPDDSGPYNSTSLQNPPKIPMRRDVVLVRPNGNLALRFRADNPDMSPIPPLPRASPRPS